MTRRKVSHCSETVTVELKVTSEFKLPPWYVTANPEQTEEALRFGASLYDIVKSTTHSHAIATIEERKSAEIATIRKDADARMEELSGMIRNAEQALQTSQRAHTQRTTELLETMRASEDTIRSEERERVTKQLENKIKAVESDLNAQHERIKALQAGKAVLESDRDRDIRVAEERTKLLLQHALDEKERSIQRAEKSLIILQEAYNRQAEELHTLSDLIRKKPTVNVKNKGTEYEEIFRAKLVAAYEIDDRFSLVDTARNGIGHAGDYLMNYDDNTILWETKNYDKNVPSAEVEKFRRDVKENPQVRIGVMVSRYTPITGKTRSGNREIEFMEGKMLIYLSEFESMSDDTLPSLMLLFRLWWASERNSDTGESLEATIRLIERLHTNAVKSKTEWRLHKSRLEETLRWMAEQVEDHEEKLKHALNLLQGDNTLHVDVPEGVFRNCDGDAKMLRDIQCILDFAEPDPDGYIIMNDLADYLAKCKGLSRDTARTHIRSALLDSMIEKKPGQKDKVLGLSKKSGIEHM